MRERISIDDMQFGFMPGRGTTDAIFILRQLQEKHLAKNKKLYFAFVDLEKAFDRVPRKVIWWAMRKLGIEEWIVRFVQAMYNNTRSRVRVNNTYSDEFGVKVGVHQGSVLSPLLFVIVLEALSCKFRTGTPWELLYADDLVISAETEEGLKMKLNKWKTEMEAKGLRVNIGKTKIMVSGVNLQTLKDSGEYPCSVCRKGVGSNSIYCAGCWMSINDNVIKQFKIDAPYITKIYTKSDNAGCYHTSHSPEALYRLCKSEDIQLLRYDYNEPCKGKDQCDRVSESAKAVIRSYIDAGNDLMSSLDVFNAMHYGFGVKDAMVCGRS